jgi:hypothetical protein
MELLWLRNMQLGQILLVLGIMALFIVSTIFYLAHRNWEAAPIFITVWPSSVGLFFLVAWLLYGIGS